MYLVRISNLSLKTTFVPFYCAIPCGLLHWFILSLSDHSKWNRRFFRKLKTFFSRGVATLGTFTLWEYGSDMQGSFSDSVLFFFTLEKFLLWGHLHCGSTVQTRRGLHMYCNHRSGLIQYISKFVRPK